MLVIDDGGVWMNVWNDHFRTLRIQYLRSPLQAHPDPRDADSLREFAASMTPLPPASAASTTPASSATSKNNRRGKVATPLSLDAIELETIFNTGGAKRAGKKQRKTGNFCMMLSLYHYLSLHNH
jgi:hypothetical protein